MAGWTCPDRETIEWDGTIKARRKVISPAIPTDDIDCANKAYVDDKALSTIQTIYPIGSIYISTLSTNPNTLLGFGTWATFGAGKVLVGLDSGDSSFDTVEETGGSKNAIVVSHNHGSGSTGSESSHTHSMAHNHAAANLPSSVIVEGGDYSTGKPDYLGLEGYEWGPNDVPVQFDMPNYTGNTGAGSSHLHSISSEGSSGTNANLQPYIVVYMWKRTA